MLCTIIRLVNGDNQIEGQLSLKKLVTSDFVCTEEEIFVCKTLELPWLYNKPYVSCIPVGTYEALKHVSPAKGKSIWLRDVPDRSEILIHIANYVGSNNPKTGKPDLEGCIGVGKELKDITGDGIKELYMSASAMNQLFDLISDQFRITIEEQFSVGAIA